MSAINNGSQKVALLAGREIKPVGAPPG